MNTNSATSLDRLHDIVAPSAVPWWPPAPGWYWAIAVAGIVLFALLLKMLTRWQQNRYRREALAELARLEGLLEHPDHRANALLALAELLKRTAITAFPREEVATLTGTQWFEFLDRTEHKADFGHGLGAILENAIYDPLTVDSLDEHRLHTLTTSIRHWIQLHNPKFNRTQQGKQRICL